MKIYIVTTGVYSSYQIRGAFSTREKAQEYVDLCAKIPHYTSPSIEVYRIDERDCGKHDLYWECELRVDNGELAKEIQEFAEEEDYRPACAEGEIRSTLVFARYMPEEVEVISVQSYRSAERALKLAVDMRQAILREDAENER